MQKELVFCGVQRQQCLNELIDAFHAVNSGVDDKEAESSGRVVLVSAEPGLGKTRLISELYKKLQSTLDKECYWPARCEGPEGNAALMPASAACNYDARLPFFWWAISVNNVPNGNAVMESLERALPHLTALEYARRRDASGKSLIKEIGDTAADVGLDLAELSVDLAGEAVGYGTLKRVGQAVFKIGKTVRAHREPESLPTLEASERVDSVVDTVLLNLDAMLNPASKRYAKRPAVIVIDDAQFSRSDRAICKFVETVIARMNQHNWPLLLIIAHWKRDMRTTQGSDDQDIEKSPIAQVIEHARTGKSPGKWANQVGSTLDDNQFVTLDLSSPIDALNLAITDFFPGLQADAVSLIDERAGGNPRKLEQILKRIDETPAWFTDPKTPTELNSEGLEEVRRLSQLPVDAIALERFQNTPADVRDGVVRASLIGFRFVVALLEKLGSDDRAESIRESLELAEERYAFVNDIADKSVNDIGQFSESAFLEAARQYITKGLADRDLENWPGEQSLLDSLDKLLVEILQAEATDEALTDDDLSFIYGFSSLRLNAKKDRMAGLALAKQVRIDNRRGDYEGAAQAAIDFAKGFEA